MNKESAYPATSRKRGLRNALVWTVIIVATCWALSPFYWAIITSFKPPGVILSKPSLIPFLQFKPTLFNWKNEYLTRGREITGALANSIIIAGGATLIAVSLGTMAGYGLARFRFRRWKNKDITLWFLSHCPSRCSSCGTYSKNCPLNWTNRPWWMAPRLASGGAGCRGGGRDLFLLLVE
jgi:ABC-type glycerol-3-phosphate transport system permease component